MFPLLPDYIDGEDIDSDLSQAWELNQMTIQSFFTAVDDWDEDQKLKFIIAVGRCAYAFDYKSGDLEDFDVDLYQLDSMKELAEHFVEEGLYGEIPERLQYYIDVPSRVIIFLLGVIRYFEQVIKDIS